MKFLSALLIWVALSSQALALDLPALRGHVNDYAAMLSPERAAALEQQLSDFERSDSTQIVVLTIPTLGGESIEEFSIKVAEAWKIGQKGVDNGVILLVAKAERKVRIEVGRGLEGKLTDLVSGRIIRADIAPKFKTGDFDGGIVAGANALIEVAKGEYKAAPRDLHQGKRGAPPLFTLLVFLAVAAVFLSSFSR
ncbi:MAG TPA: TPM domain-containing protein, partial [Geobacteraceae bacterium]|nr:TPM domain-containing protein [Geobacteraceae bacterium]